MYDNAEYEDEGALLKDAWKPACAKIRDCVGCGTRIGKPLAKGVCNYCWVNELVNTKLKKYKDKVNL